MQKKDEISLKYLFLNFLKIGSISWGGFMALISVVRKQMVEKDKTVKDEVILDGISLASVLPGPVAFNVVAYIGYSLRGFSGALVSMVAIILPSFFLILGLAFLYVTYGEIPAFKYFFMGVLPAIAAVIISVATGMFQKQVKDWKQIALCVLSGLALVFIHSFFVTLSVILISALIGFFVYRDTTEEAVQQTTVTKTFQLRKYLVLAVLMAAFILLLWFLPVLLTGQAKANYKLLQTIFFTFSGMSLTLFGGGYVIIPAMQQVIVDGFHWLSVNEFADAIAMGQITPGPIFISATFIGYRVAGLLGAFVATIAIFFPPGILMVVLSRFLERIKQSAAITAAFKGMRPAIIGMIFSAAITIGKEAELAWPSGFIFVLVLALLIKFKVNVVYVIPLSGLAGILLFQL